MQLFRTVILISCVFSVIRSAMDITLKNNSMKKQLMTMIGIMAVISTATALMGEDMQLSLNMPELQSDENIGIRAENIMLASAEKEYEEYFMEKLNKIGISTDSVNVLMETNSSAEVFVYSVCVELQDISREDEAKALIAEDLPEAFVTAVKSNEA